MTKEELLVSLREILKEEIASPEKEDWVSRMVGSCTPKDRKPGEDPLFDALAAKYLRE